MSSQALALLLPLPVALPLAGAVAAPLLARPHRRLAVIVGLVALGGSIVLLLLQAPSVFGGLVRAHYLGLWATGARPGPRDRACRRPVRPDLSALTAAVVGAVLLLLGQHALLELGGRARRTGPVLPACSSWWSPH